MLGKFWEVGHRADEGVRWLQAALEAAGPAAPIADRARACVELGPLLGMDGSVQDAIAAGPRALALARESGDDALIADALIWLCEFGKTELRDPEELRPIAIEGLAHACSADDERLIAWALMARAGNLPPGAQAEREYHEAAAALRNIGDHWHLVSLNNTEVYGAIVHGDYADAARLLDEVLPLALETGEPWKPLMVWGNLGLVRLLTGDEAGARIAFEEQLRLCRDHNLRFVASEGVGGLAAIAADEQHLERAARLLGAASAIGSIAHPDLMAKLEQQFFDSARARVGDRRWNDALQAGRGLAFRDAIELALAAPD